MTLFVTQSSGRSELNVAAIYLIQLLLSALQHVRQIYEQINLENLAVHCFPLLAIRCNAGQPGGQCEEGWGENSLFDWFIIQPAVLSF